MAKLNALLSSILLTFIVVHIHSTPLDDYVNTPDSHYEWKMVNWTFKGDGYTMYCINMTSQKWLTENETYNPIWYHNINIAVPDKILITDTAFLYIALGANDPK